MSVPSENEVWQRALIEAAKETPKLTRDVLVFDRAAVRRSLRESREHRGRPVPHRIKSILP